ncbi:DUF371 domain-containing protein [Candidatus Woesearchaeota archaeon]|nr:DUF371 domain-containing protein [Candidatus Woesearchaeota archaeon]
MIKFTCTGHENVLAEHMTTLEFTRDNYLTEEGDCIVGINSDFDHETLMNFVQEHSKAKVTIQVDNIAEEIIGEINKEFKSEHEIVLRLGMYKSDRTLLVNCDKAAKHLSRDLIDALKKGKKMQVTIVKS